MDGERRMKAELARLFQEALENHRGCVFGAAVGAFCSISILLFGFWNMVFIGVCVAAGLWLGQRIDESDDVRLDRLRELNMKDIFHRQR